MAKERVCPKCGKTENEFTFFCTECGWKTEIRNVESSLYSQTRINGHQDIFKDEHVPYLGKPSRSENADTILNKEDSEALQSADEDVTKTDFEIRDVDEAKCYSPLSGESDSEVNSDSFYNEDEYFIDFKCPNCHETLSFMNWQLRDAVSCPMCSAQFNYDEKTRTTVAIDRNDTDIRTDEDGDYWIQEPSKSKEPVAANINAHESTMESVSINSGEDEFNLDESDDSFVDVFCPHCGSALAFPNWQIESEELICPICEGKFKLY